MDCSYHISYHNYYYIKNTTQSCSFPYFIPPLSNIKLCDAYLRIIVYFKRNVGIQINSNQFTKRNRQSKSKSETNSKLQARSPSHHTSNPPSLEIQNTGINLQINPRRVFFYLPQFSQDTSKFSLTNPLPVLPSVLIQHRLRRYVIRYRGIHICVCRSRNAKHGAPLPSLPRRFLFASHEGVN